MSQDDTTAKSGWCRLTEYPSVCEVIDILLDSPPARDFTQAELAELADVHRNSVGKHIDLLVQLDVLGTRETDSGQTLYHFNQSSPVSCALIELDGEVMEALIDGQ